MLTSRLESGWQQIRTDLVSYCAIPGTKNSITGYVFEPWHFRYIGVERATLMRASGFSTYEEFVGAEPAPGYVDPAN
ncbi:M15 family metallopeptidase domain-containing protein [Renibacterium salmoninarum]|uniref:hypothetical protein n=1 Tax=Renibacterium salmoninarum TaxID=1646 RepID=UPI0002E421CC|nr:hypothetical protein [Renibacterium salmoninarum]